MNVIKQVAEAKCLEVVRLGREHIPGDTCLPCATFNAGDGSKSGAGLRWPTLSRECSCWCHTEVAGWEKLPEHPNCYVAAGEQNCVSGRVPDVKLENWFSIGKQSGWDMSVSLCGDGGYTAQIWIDPTGQPTDDYFAEGETWELATCAALLAT